MLHLLCLDTTGTMVSNVWHSTAIGPHTMPAFQCSRATIKGVPHGTISVPAGVSPCWALRVKIVPSSESRVGESFENFWAIEQVFSRLESQTISGIPREWLENWLQARLVSSVSAEVPGTDCVHARRCGCLMYMCMWCVCVPMCVSAFASTCLDIILQALLHF